MIFEIQAHVVTCAECSATNLCIFYAASNIVPKANALISFFFWLTVVVPNVKKMAIIKIDTDSTCFAVN